MKNEEAVIQTQTQECPTSCNEGYEYQEIEGKCCGICVATKCKLENGTLIIPGIVHNIDECTKVSCKIIDGIPELSQVSKSCPPMPDDCKPENIKNDGCCDTCIRCKDSFNNSRKVGETWVPDSCTTCSCLDDGSTQCTKKNCPVLPENCPFEAITSDGCCQYCNLPEKLESCALTFNETKQPREVTIPADGEENCINLEKIEGWTGCQGHCNSEVLYTNGEFVSDCHCCQAADFESREIPVICSRGNIKTAVIRFPSKCQCLLCGSPLDGASNIIETPHLTEDREEIANFKTAEEQQSYYVPRRNLGQVSVEDIFGDTEK